MSPCPTSIRGWPGKEHSERMILVNLCLVVLSQAGHFHGDATVDTILQFS